MKKLFSFIAALALGFSFTACEDVPAPYGINNKVDTTQTAGGDKTLFEANFDAGQDGFTFHNVKLSEGLSYVWKQTAYNSSTYLIASAFANNKSNASESWAISPAINLSDSKHATLTFRHAINKIGDANLERMKDMMTLWVSTDFAGDPTKANWKQVVIPTYPAGTNWTFVDAGTMDLTSFCGNEKVFLGFKYMSEDGISGSWEVDAVKLTGDGTPTKVDTPDTPVVDGKLPYTAAFSTSLEGWTNHTISGAGAWVNKYNAATATGYDNSTKKNTPGTYILVSPEIQLNAEDAHVMYEYILRFKVNDSDQQVLISDAYNEATPDAGWTLLNQTHTEGKDYNTFYPADLQIPAKFLGKKVRFALRFNCGEKSGTWEVKNFKVDNGKATEQGGGTQGGGEQGGGSTSTPSGTGTVADPYNVAAAFSKYVAGDTIAASVKGYIVGYVDGQSIQSGAKFDLTATNVSATNLLIADAADVKDYTKCIVVQLPAGDIRTALNLKDNPANLGKQVILTGGIIKYFGVAGLKELKSFSFVQ